MQQTLENLRIQWAQRTQSESLATSTGPPRTEAPADSYDVDDNSQSQANEVETGEAQVVVNSAQGKPGGHDFCDGDQRDNPVVRGR